MTLVFLGHFDILLRHYLPQEHCVNRVHRVLGTSQNSRVLHHYRLFGLWETPRPGLLPLCYVATLCTATVLFRVVDQGIQSRLTGRSALYPRTRLSCAE
jgi:hypothetical protein